MDRDEFMQLVYETFADEPDNVLANGIIEAADAYVEHEKAQLSQQGTTSDTISRQAAIDALAEQMPTPYTPDGSHPADEQIFQVQEVYADCITTIELLPTIQPVATDTNVGDAISRQAAIDALDCINGTEEVLRSLPPARPEPTDINAKEAVYNLAEKIGIHQLFALTVELRGEPIQPEPKEGHWIPHETPDGGEQYECSLCGVLWEFNDGTPEDNEAYFCPKCGKKLITK